MRENYHVRKVIGSYDIMLLLLVVLLCAFGTVMVFSTSYYNAERFYSSAAMYYLYQIRNVIIGGVLMIAVSLFDYHKYVKLYMGRVRLIYIIYLICFILQTIVAIAGYSANGSSRWLNVAGVSFQPSELTKICFIMVTAYCVTKNRDSLDTIRGILPLTVLLPLAFLVVMGDLSTAFVLAVIMVIPPLIVSGFRKYHFVSLGVGIAGILTAALTLGYRADRIKVWLNPELQDTGSQTVQGLYAIASGDFFGKGLGEGLQKLGKIQEVHTDMIFTVVCEELGIAGAVVIIVMYLLLLWRIYVIAVNAKDMFGGLICAGVFAHIAIQVIINLFVVTDMMPSTGIPLPFISYGGTSLVVLLAEMGLVLNVSKQIPAGGDDDVGS